MKITTLICTRCKRSETFGTGESMSKWFYLKYKKSTKTYMCPQCKKDWELMMDVFIEYNNRTEH